jgi:hypothetical protein
VLCRFAAGAFDLIENALGNFTVADCYGEMLLHLLKNAGALPKPVAAFRSWAFLPAFDVFGFQICKRGLDGFIVERCFCPGCPVAGL